MDAQQTELEKAKAAGKFDKLLAYQRPIVERTMQQHPALTFEEAVEHLDAAGM
jgi:hypothetical protein